MAEEKRNKEATPNTDVAGAVNTEIGKWQESYVPETCEDVWVLSEIRIRIPVTGQRGIVDSKRVLGKKVDINYEFINFRRNKQVVAPLDRVPSEVRDFAARIEEAVRKNVERLGIKKIVESE